MPPQLKPPGPLEQLLIMQVTCATCALHTAPLMRQRLLTQQPAAPQVLVWQQAWSLPPQATKPPFEHTMPEVAGAPLPDATHEPPLQQPPPPQVLPAQQA